MLIYNPVENGTNRIYSYGKYDVVAMKTTIQDYLYNINYCIQKDLNRWIIVTGSTIDSKNNNIIYQVYGYSPWQMRNKTDFVHYTNNARLEAIYVTLSHISTVEYCIPKMRTVINQTIEIPLGEVKVFKCKLGWIKSVNKDKTGY